MSSSNDNTGEGHPDALNPVRVTQRDIARRAGVHQCTVSKVLRNHPKVGPSARHKVLQAIEEMGYRSDPVLSALARHRWPDGRAVNTATLAFVNLVGRRQDRAALNFNPYKIEHLSFEGARRRAEELGYRLDEFWLDEYESLSTLGRALYNRGIQGLLLTQPPEKFDLEMDWGRFCNVVIGQDLSHPLLNNLSFDWYEAMRLAVDCGRRHGYRKTGFALFDFDSWNRNDPMKAAALVEREKLERDFAYKIPILIYRDDSKEKFFKWYEQHKPELVICTSVKVFWWLREEGIRMPEEIGLVSLQKHYNPRLPNMSAIDIRPDIMGRRGVEMLNSLLHMNLKGLLEPPLKSMITPNWFPGETTRQLPPR